MLVEGSMELSGELEIAIASSILHIFQRIALEIIYEIGNFSMRLIFC